MTIVRIAVLVATVLLGASAWSSDLESGDPVVKGLAIAKEQVRRDTGWIDSKANLLMTLRNKQGAESLREIEIRLLEGAPTAGDKSLLVFDKPLDVRGTALLTYSHVEGSDDQWIYLPAVKRVKRISSRNKTGPFMGSEFSYEDLSSFEHEKFTYLYLREEDVDDHACYVFEQYPKDKHSGYTKRVVWIDKEAFRVQKIEFFDRKKSLLKTLEVDGYEKFLDAYWRPQSSTMTNHQTGKSTTLDWSNYAFKVGLDSKDFKVNSLKRVR